VVVHASKLLSQVASSDPSIVLPCRIALLDVFSTVGMKAYASGWPILVLLQRELAELRDLGVVLEQYQTSLIGRRGLRFQNLTAFVELDPPHIPWYRLKSRHIAAPCESTGPPSHHLIYIRGIATGYTDGADRNGLYR
jgi:hypothetical protein